jgi:hypothetical protein
MVLDDPVGGAQAKACPFANGFSRVKGIKDALRIAYAWSGI